MTHPTNWGDKNHTDQAYGHNGFDVGVPKGTAVYASAAGTVVYAGKDDERGNTIIIEHSIGNSGYSYFSYYQHLLSFTKKENDSVSAGTEIAKSGNSGSGTGYHLHFGIVMAKSGSIKNTSTLFSVESKGWVLTSGYAEGRILNNPSTSSTFPSTDAHKGAVLTPLGAHSGSVSYTFDQNKVSIGSDQILADGTYHIASALNTNYVLDLTSGSSSNGANIQLYKNSFIDNQSFTVKYLSNGYYEISSVKSGKVLDGCQRRKEKRHQRTAVYTQQFRCPKMDAQRCWQRLLLRRFQMQRSILGCYRWKSRQ